MNLAVKGAADQSSSGLPLALCCFCRADGDTHLPSATYETDPKLPLPPHHQHKSLGHNTDGVRTAVQAVVASSELI